MNNLNTLFVGMQRSQSGSGIEEEKDIPNPARATAQAQIKVEELENSKASNTQHSN